MRRPSKKQWVIRLVACMLALCVANISYGSKEDQSSISIAGLVQLGMDIENIKGSASNWVKEKVDGFLQQGASQFINEVPERVGKPLQAAQDVFVIQGRAAETLDVARGGTSQDYLDKHGEFWDWMERNKLPAMTVEIFLPGSRK